MDIKKLQRVIVDGLEEVKGQDIVVFDTEHLSSLFERVIIASGTSNRQTKSLAASVRDAVKEAGYPVPRTEGEGNGEWIIVDCGAAVVHLMQPNIRGYYHLEEIWGDKPVKLKLDTAPKRLVKAEEVAAPTAAKTPAKKAPARKTATTSAADKAPAKKAPAKPAPARRSALVSADGSPAQRRTPAAKSAAPAKRAAAVKTGVTRTTGTKSGGSAASTAAPLRAGKAPVRKSALAPSARVVKKAPVQVMAVNKPSTKKAASARAAVNAAPAKRPPAKKASGVKTAPPKASTKKAPRGA
jgi:ribosome-associated protein